MSLCLPSPVATACLQDTIATFPGTYSLGICGDPNHQTRPSGHNSGAMRELSCTDPRYAHAVDLGVPDVATGLRIVAALRNDPRVYYVIHDFVGYRPWWRGGSTWSAADHDHHVHVSFYCGTTFDVRPFYADLTPPEPVFPMGVGDTGFAVGLVEATLVHAGYAGVVVDGRYGPQTKKASQDLQRFLGRQVRPQTTEADFEAFGKWANFVTAARGRPDPKTLNDRGPRVRALNRDLAAIGQDVDLGGVYTEKTQAAVANVQRFFDLPFKAGNARPEDRQFIRHLAEAA